MGKKERVLDSKEGKFATTPHINKFLKKLNFITSFENRPKVVWVAENQSLIPNAYVRYLRTTCLTKPRVPNVLFQAPQRPTSMHRQEYTQLKMRRKEKL